MDENFRYSHADSRFQCTGCKLLMVTPIYMCPSGHNSCEDCKHIYPCRLCDKPITQTRNYNLEGLTYTTLFSCRWQYNCGAFSCRTIRAHEASCSHRIYKCPATFCDFDGYFSEIPVHLDLKHPYIEFHPLATYRRHVKQDHMWFMMAYYELFVCKFTLDRNTVEWSMHLQAPYARARELVCDLEVGGKLFPLKLVNYFGPKYEIELPYDMIPQADEFFFILRITRSNSYIV